MTTPTAIAWRAEIEAALAVVIPQVRGLKDLRNVSLSEETLGFIAEELDDHTRRRDLLQSNLDALNALEADQYPDMPVREVPASVAAELAEQAADFDAAFGEFAAAAPATTITLSLGTPAEK